MFVCKSWCNSERLADRDEQPDVRPLEVLAKDYLGIGIVVDNSQKQNTSAGISQLPAILMTLSDRCNDPKTVHRVVRKGS